MAAPGFWNDQKVAKGLAKKLSSLKKQGDLWGKLETEGGDLPQKGVLCKEGGGKVSKEEVFGGRHHAFAFGFNRFHTKRAEPDAEQRAGAQDFEGKT